MQYAVFPVTITMVNLFYVCLQECMEALNMDAIVQSIYRFACVASPGETIRLIATVATLVGDHLYYMPYGGNVYNWQVINIAVKYSTIVFKVSNSKLLSTTLLTQL